VVIVDTSVWIDYLNDKANAQTLWLNFAIENKDIGLSSLILCEVLQGFHTSREADKTCNWLLSFHVFETGDTRLAIQSSENYRLLRQKGVTIRSSIDCLIATFCIDEGHQLLHKDSDFDGFENHLGLHVLHPPAIPFELI
jgi:predicted nucleic acid-binding protein